MKKIDVQAFEEIMLWVYRNARPVDLATWQYEFENGSKEAVLSALTFYQNADGGFGHALEPDCWNPGSSPYTTSMAIDILKRIGFSDTKHPVMQGILKYLNSGAYSTDAGWHFNIPSNDDYPHAPWWTYNPEANVTESIGLTAKICCFILTYSDHGSALYQKAMNITAKLIDLLKTPGDKGDMGISGYCELLETINTQKLTEQFDVAFLTDTVKGLVNNSIERDSTKWPYYSIRPSRFITSPDSPFYADNADIVQQELDFLIDTRPEAGVWPITWSWFDNNEKYASAFAISENWWKVMIATDTLRLLRSFDRVQK